MQAQLTMDAHRRELDATKAELQACREKLESALGEVQEKAEHVQVMVSYFHNVVEGQMKPQLLEAETTASQLHDQVAALSNDLASVKSQLTQKTKESEHLKEQVAALTSELEAAKGEVSEKNTATILLEDQVATLKTALHEKSRADGNKMEWFWVCIVSLVVAVVAHAWSLLVAVMSWTWMFAMSACPKVKTWSTAVIATDKATDKVTDKNDQDVKREQWSVGRMSVVGLLLVGVGVLVFLGVTTIATKDGTLTHPLHDVTSGPLPWMPSGLAGDAIPMVVDGTSSEPLFADTTVFSPVDDGDETQDDDPEENELVGSMVGTAFGVATTTAGCV
ncbi:hypothetical protein AeMF1_018723, partial [Aphanomyces euteiches]